MIKTQNDDPLTRKIIACAIEVHKRFGPGLLEKLYKETMVIELEFNQMKVGLLINFNQKMVKDGIKHFVL